MSRTTRPELADKTAEAARLIVKGNQPHTVIDMMSGKQKFPKLEEGRHGASAVVDGYKRQVISDMYNLLNLLTDVCLSPTAAVNITDVELNKIALAAEVTVNYIQRYLRVKEAGGARLEEAVNAD